MQRHSTLSGSIVLHMGVGLSNAMWGGEMFLPCVALVAWVFVFVVACAAVGVVGLAMVLLRVFVEKIKFGKDFS